jgi:hypothetical protein
MWVDLEIGGGRRVTQASCELSVVFWWNIEKRNAVGNRFH